MAYPDPKPGLFVRYDYLWTHEATGERDHGKDRATCLVAASDSQSTPRLVVLLPITVGIEIPAKVKRLIGLDETPSWGIVSEHNVDEWPNAGLSPVPGNQVCSFTASFPRPVYADQIQIPRARPTEKEQRDTSLIERDQQAGQKSVNAGIELRRSQSVSAPRVDNDRNNGLRDYW